MPSAGKRPEPQPQLKPLEQWLCDTCGDVIEGADAGWLEWLAVDTGKRPAYQEFRIVHRFGKQADGVDPCTRQGSRRVGPDARGMDLQLDRFVGQEGLPAILSFVDVGPFREDPYEGPLVKNLREWTELFRRLYLPYFEEGRLLLSRAHSDGYVNEHSEQGLYLPRTLLEVIHRYSEES